MDKVNILITSPAHTFAESMLLVVSKLILNHNVFVILVDNIENSAVSLKLDDLGLISYIIIPNNIPAQYAILERNLNELKAYKFNIWISISNIQPFEKFIQKFNYTIDLISDEDESLCKQFDVLKLKKMYGKEHIGIVRSTFVISPDGDILNHWDKVKVDGHAQEVLDFVKRQ